MRSSFRAMLVTVPIIGLAIAAPAGSRPRPKAPPEVVAKQLLSTVTLTRKWAEFLYAIRPPVQNGCEPFASELVFDEDGTFHQTVIDEDCTRTEITGFPDLSYTMDILYSNGLREEMSSAPSEFLPPPLESLPRTFAIQHEFSNGNHVAYTHELDWTEDLSVEAEHFTGSFTLQNEKLTFALDRVNSFDSPPDRFRATLPGGVDYTLDIPRDPFELRLDFRFPAEGVLKMPEGALPFRLIATNPDTDRRWDRLEVGPKLAGRRRGVVNGTFALERNFSGGGQMFRGKRLDFVVRWNRGQTGQVVLPNGTSATAGPAEGLLAFLNLRWSGLASGFGPSPGL